VHPQRPASSTNVYTSNSSQSSRFRPSPPILDCCLPLFSCYHTFIGAAISPHTSMFRILLELIFLWQAWNCTMGLSYSPRLALSPGHGSADRLDHRNFAMWCVALNLCLLTPEATYQIGVFAVELRSLKWASIKKPSQKYEPFVKSPNTLVERRLPSATFSLIHSISYAISAESYGCGHPSRAPA